MDNGSYDSTIGHEDSTELEELVRIKQLVAPGFQQIQMATSDAGGIIRILATNASCA